MNVIELATAIEITVYHIFDSNLEKEINLLTVSNWMDYKTGEPIAGKESSFDRGLSNYGQLKNIGISHHCTTTRLRFAILLNLLQVNNFKV